MTDKDKIRLQELKQIVWGKVAKNFIIGKDSPYDICSNDIERNRGRVNKALRLLSDNIALIKPKVKDTDEQDGEILRYKVLTFEESKSYGVKPPFDFTWLDLNETHWFSNRSDSYEPMKFNINQLALTGLRGSFRPEEYIYIYWNQNEYFQDGEYFCEKSKLDSTRQKVMRLCIERVLFENFGDMLADFADVDAVKNKTNTLNVKKPLKVFSMGQNDMDDSATNISNNLKAAQRNKQQFEKTLQAVLEYGGFQKVIEMFRRKLIDTFINGGDYLRRVSHKDETAYFTINKFFEEHHNICSYEMLYESEIGDSSITYLEILKEY